jgi:hypothetical protein
VSLAALLLLWRFAVSQDPTDGLSWPAAQDADQAWVQPATPARQAPLVELGRRAQGWGVSDPDASGTKRIESRPSRITK